MHHVKCKACTAKVKPAGSPGWDNQDIIHTRHHGHFGNCRAPLKSATWTFTSPAQTLQRQACLQRSAVFVVPCTDGSLGCSSQFEFFCQLTAHTTGQQGFASVFDPARKLPGDKDHLRSATRR